MQLAVDATDPAAVGALARLLGSARGGRSEVFLRAPLDGGKAAVLFLGDDYLIGADQVDAIALIPGLAIHKFERMEPKADGYRARNRRSGLRLVAG
jgi:DNA polymerase-3 subunit alpha